MRHSAMPGEFTDSKRSMAAVLLCAAVLCAGCRKSPEPSGDGQTADAKPPAKTNGDANGVKQAAKPPQPQTPDAAVAALLRGVREKRPEAVWDFLPASYQQDVSELVHLFGRKMDPELWRRTMTVGRRIVALCRDRKAAILGSNAAEGIHTGDLRRLAADWDALLALAETILASELADLEKVKTLDVREFLKSTGGDVLRQLARFSRLLPEDALQGELEQFADLEVKVLSSDADSARLRLSLRSAADASQELSFVKVEGQWVPAGLAANWKSNVAAVRKDLQDKLRPEVLQKNKTTMLAILDGFEKELAAMETAKTDVEFLQRFESSALPGLIVATFRSVSRSTAPPGVPVTPKNAGRQKSGKTAGMTVTVIVQGVLDDEAAEGIADKLFALGNVDVGVHTTADGTTRFPVHGVKNFEVFRRKIAFAKVVSADAKKREIVIRAK